MRDRPQPVNARQAHRLYQATAYRYKMVSADQLALVNNLKSLNYQQLHQPGTAIQDRGAVLIESKHQ